MARIVVKTAQNPYVLKPQQGEIKICMCGLSHNQPFCDGSHMKTQDEKEGTVYCYHEDGTREEMCKDCDESCKGECQCHSKDK